MKPLQSWLCPDHQFLIVGTKAGTITCRQSPGQRDMECALCDRAAEDAISWAQETS